MRIRRMVAKDLKSGATITGDVLLEANRRTQYQQHGRHRPAPLGDRRDHPQLVSDDNYSALQRTLLMQFPVPEGKPVLAEPSAR